VAEVECGDGVDLQLRQRLKALPFVSTSAELLLVTANADTHLFANPRRHPVSNVRWQTCRRPIDVALRGANRPHDGLLQYRVPPGRYQRDGRIPLD
jgi:hypothetical protein